MKIKEIRVSVRKSKNFQTYEASATAEIDNDKEVMPVELNKLKARLKESVMKWIEDDMDCQGQR